MVRYNEQVRVIEHRDHSLVEQSLQAKESMLIELHTELDKLRSELRKHERLSDDASKVRASPPPVSFPAHANVKMCSQELQCQLRANEEMKKSISQLKLAFLSPAELADDAKPFMGDATEVPPLGKPCRNSIDPLQ